MTQESSSSSSSPTPEDVLALKRQALQAKKDGDIEAAKSFLRQAKELQQQILQQQQQQQNQQQNGGGGASGGGASQDTPQKTA
eukprot:CAMPEP_0117056742 /NCGR_PEP_ID=MMETSP0472-20121206/39377_1 /TAXON_ID=693140 ORGANISM="Tiarina fusus, Strain LIS" /NCGR_SAMPLE_ID=MMETSP0472 /ASSEMBLY_ACC=CAM_ASM_000603 /LENGTH=82 /DNA_ID=CAMNT_0004773325 /DNA_START=149 /DNA_END=393 /DNA_ORIENTATION=-